MNHQGSTMAKLLRVLLLVAVLAAVAAPAAAVRARHLSQCEFAAPDFAFVA